MNLQHSQTTISAQENQKALQESEVTNITLDDGTIVTLSRVLLNVQSHNFYVRFNKSRDLARLLSFTVFFF